MPVAIISGEPGTVWQNNTGKILFQLHVDFVRSCALCIQFAGRIGPYWPVPYHDHCHCRNIPIKPGQQAMPFIDYQDELRKLGPVAQRNAMGASNWRLVESGLAKWEDVVTKGRVRDFREVADRLDLGVDRMVKAGVRPDLARKAYDATHTEAHAATAKDRAALIKGLKAHGVKDGRIAAEVGDLLASRVGVVGPGGSVSGIAPPPAPKPPKPAPAKVAAMPSAPAPKPVSQVGKPPVAPGPPKPPPPKPAGWQPSPASDFRKFRTIESMEEWGQGASRAWSATLTPDERSNVDYYSQHGYTYMNYALRDPAAAMAEIGVEPFREIQRRNAATAAVLSRARTPDAITAYRGVKDSAKLGIDPAGLVPGSILSDAGFGSVSLSREVAEGFAKNMFGDPIDPALFEIRMPSGSSGAYLNAGMLSNAPKEREFLCPPGSEFRVVGRGKDTKEGVPVVILERVK